MFSYFDKIICCLSFNLNDKAFDFIESKYCELKTKINERILSLEKEVNELKILNAKLNKTKDIEK